MRGIFGLIGLLVVVAIVGLLAKKQLSAGVAPVANAPGSSAPAATPKAQVQQFEQAVQGALQQARPMPDNEK
ncbi:MAG TPA: hypothetical protein VF522_07805 [Ramlibacter sp.]|uniref:type II secretion system protein n=1 Tax=Ramlibacter sp. TaxID=1917967 RepID=UPI002ED039A3